MAEDKKEGDQVAAQENVSPKDKPARSASKKEQVRHRASVACASCRDRRIRCVVPSGQAECNQCRRAGTECIIKNDDERRRPISKAYMSSLSDRINLLEGMLKESGVNPPPASHPPKTKHGDKGQQSDSEHGKQRQSPSVDVPSPPDSTNDLMVRADFEGTDPMMTESQSNQVLSKEDSPFRMLDPKQEDIVHRLLSTNGNLSFDQLSGRLRFFGPTANSHVYADSPDHYDSREPPEQVRRAERIIRSLSATTYEYLMSHFWEHYNGIIPVIERSAFEADRDTQNPRFYSSFLHICILAMGYRGCDTERDDMKRITLSNRESTLHREAKFMLDVELERPGGIPSVQALLLLGDLECGVGRDNTGWMYAGMANRLAFDIGLHLDCRNNGMPEAEVHIRRMTMRACVIYDKYWALFLGRPTSIKSQDLGMELLSDKFSQLTSDTPATPKTLNGEVYEQLIELMELAGRIVESRDYQVVKTRLSMPSDGNVFVNEAGDNEYLHVINLDRQLQNWYRRLPEHLAWKPANIKRAPWSFFLLHQQYHVSMILLHRPWAKYDSITDGASTGSAHPSPQGTAAHAMDTSGHDIHDQLGDPLAHDSRTSLSRSICTQQAIRVARIFWQHRQRFDGRKIHVTGIQHAGTAVLALIAALAYQKSDTDRRTYMGYLEILSDALGDMNVTYHPAGRMDDLLKAVLTQIRLSLGEPSTRVHPAGHMSGVSDYAASLIPSRREADETTYSQPLKKRRPGTNSRRASEFARPPPPFFSQIPSTQPTPPASAHRVPTFANEFQQQQQQRTPNQVDNMLFSLGAGDGSHIDLDFLSGSAVDLDGDNDGKMDWGMGSMHSDNPPQTYEAPMGDFGPGPAGLSASSVLGQQSSALSSELMSNATFGVKAGETELTEQLHGMSPASLSGLVQSVEKSDEVHRNQDLDFFSFD
ncbi:putative transcriptional regulatory protein -like protein [Emericellopsis cladophorae]|uniref:Transcriptional regulatory protein -like protein n=1 Tax=Emericellopsis cladophorae TaxID=2686198 RepID=A0A9Q0BE59_9HYPO|nr:putative transcriptional regulatory protein -like protein [Emericellopsis cladophorae]KAI6781280.1 putative transcriptional regulatory protein -like protein [Emericellopsis cladophorae]